MHKSLFQTLSRRSPTIASRYEVCEAPTYGFSAKDALPSWVRKREPRASKKVKLELGSRQKKKVEETNCRLAPPSQSVKLLSVAEAAWRLSLSEKTIRRMIDAGNLAVIRIGRSIRINPEVIEKIIRQNE